LVKILNHICIIKKANYGDNKISIENNPIKKETIYTQICAKNNFYYCNIISWIKFSDESSDSIMFSEVSIKSFSEIWWNEWDIIFNLLKWSLFLCLRSTVHKKNFQGLFRVTKNCFDNYTEQFNNLRAPFCWRTSHLLRKKTTTK
jgi:hypothetical protein